MEVARTDGDRGITSMLDAYRVFPVRPHAPPVENLGIPGRGEADCRNSRCSRVRTSPLWDRRRARRNSAAPDWTDQSGVLLPLLSNHRRLVDVTKALLAGSFARATPIESQDAAAHAPLMAVFPLPSRLPLIRGFTSFQLGTFLISG